MFGQQPPLTAQIEHLTLFFLLLLPDLLCLYLFKKNYFHVLSCFILFCALDVFQANGSGAIQL